MRTRDQQRGTGAISLGLFSLTMIGVGATIGTGIFFTMVEAVPKAGPAVIVSFLIAASDRGPYGAVLRGARGAHSGIRLLIFVRLCDRRGVRGLHHGGLPPAGIWARGERDGDRLVGLSE
jgi:hypothetical protein